MNNNIIFPLSHWLDTATGEFLDNGYGCGSLRFNLSKELLERSKYYIEFRVPIILNINEILRYLKDNSLEIRFSYSKPQTEKLVHPGIGVPEGEVTGSDLRDSIKKVKSLLLGKFTPSFENEFKLGTITLYTKNIAEFSQNKEIDYNVVFWSTFVHELFHAMHFSLFAHCDCREAWKSNGAKTNCSIVKESMAAYIQYDYLRELEKANQFSSDARNMMSNLAEEWRAYDIEDWHYSGALGIKHSLVKNPIIVLEELLKMSLNDWKTAADIIKTGYYLTDRSIRGYFI